MLFPMIIALLVQCVSSELPGTSCSSQNDAEGLFKGADGGSYCYAEDEAEWKKDSLAKQLEQWVEEYFSNKDRADRNIAG